MAFKLPDKYEIGKYDAYTICVYLHTSYLFLVQIESTAQYAMHIDC